MEITIIETNEVKELNIIDENGINWIQDFIGNDGGFGSSEQGMIEFVQSEESEGYYCTEDTFSWWENIIAEHQEAEELIAKHNINPDDLQFGNLEEFLPAVKSLI